MVAASPTSTAAPVLVAKVGVAEVVPALIAGRAGIGPVVEILGFFGGRALPGAAAAADVLLPAIAGVRVDVAVVVGVVVAIDLRHAALVAVNCSTGVGVAARTRDRTVRRGDLVAGVGVADRDTAARGRRPGRGVVRRAAPARSIVAGVDVVGLAALAPALRSGGGVVKGTFLAVPRVARPGVVSAAAPRDGRRRAPLAVDVARGPARVARSPDG